MTLTNFETVLVVITIIIQFTAIMYAFRLVSQTKYNIIWILCVIGFVLLLTERVMELFIIGSGHEIPSLLFWTGNIASVCIAGAVLFSDSLVKHIDRLTLQRQMFNRRILNAVIQTEEKSRSSFAKELHDGMGPLLSSAKMGLSVLGKSQELNPAQQEILRNTMFAVEEAIKSVREISNNMAPHILSDFGIIDALKSFISRSVALKEIRTNLDMTLSGVRFESNLEVILYRIACELINNSVKHSHCTSIDISLRQSGDELRLCYSDNGCGFDPESVLNTGMGLSNISSRINAVGGSAEFESKPGKGMKAVITASSTPTVNESYEKDSSGR